MGKVYVLVDYNCCDTYKIGVTKRNIQTRLKELNQNPGSCVKLKFLSPEAENYLEIEKKLHKTFKSYNTTIGENKSLSEWFYLESEQLAQLQLILKYEFGSTFN
jgi:hypothetical protein